MKTIVLASLLTGLAGGLLPAESNAPSQKQMSSFEREALATQSPRVRTKMHKKNASRTPDRIERDKTTINAYIPYGK